MTARSYTSIDEGAAQEELQQRGWTDG